MTAIPVLTSRIPLTLIVRVLPVLTSRVLFMLTSRLLMLIVRMQQESLPPMSLKTSGSKRSNPNQTVPLYRRQHLRACLPSQQQPIRTSYITYV